MLLLIDSKNKNADGVYRKLRELRKQRAVLKLEIDRKLVSQLVLYVESLPYNVHVVVGKVKGIRNSHIRGSGNKSLRSKIHKWTYYRLTMMMDQKFMKFFAINEAWTSKTCYKCNSRNTIRPKHAVFICKNCNNKVNADFNGAVNIAKRGVQYFKLTQSRIGKKGLGRFLLIKRKQPNPRKRSLNTGLEQPYKEMFRNDQSDGTETLLLIRT